MYPDGLGLCKELNILKNTKYQLKMPCSFHNGNRFVKGWIHDGTLKHLANMFTFKNNK